LLVLTLTASIASAEGMITVSRPLLWLLSMPSSITLLARRVCPLTLVDRLSCELKNWECGRKGRVAPGTVTSRPWKLRLKERGISVICLLSRMRPVSARSVWRGAISATTVASSVSCPTCRVRSTRTVVFTSTFTPSRAVLRKPGISTPTRYVPSLRFEKM
jgi:hypothetical protein